MSTMALCYDDQALAGTITASSSVANLGPANLQHPALSPQVWRSADTASWVKVDFGGTRTIGAVALLGTNLPVGCTVRIRLSDNEDMSTPSYDSGAGAASGIDATYRHLIKVLPAPAAGRYLLIELEDTTLAYHEAGRLVAMTAFRPTRNVSNRFRWAWLDSTRIDVAETGQSWVEVGTTRRELRLQLHALTDAEALGEFASIAALGRGRDVLVVLDPAQALPAPLSIFGLVVENLSADRLMPNLHTADLVIHERR